HARDDDEHERENEREHVAAQRDERDGQRTGERRERDAGEQAPPRAQNSSGTRRQGCSVGTSFGRGRFGRVTCSSGTRSYGTWSRRCPMMLSRARRLSFESATYHGATSVSVAANIASRALV